MDKCYIIISSSEPAGYSPGHFNRVYDYVIVPACRAAGFWPTRSDREPYENPLDVVSNIIDSEIVLCDLSADNTHALYGLAVRHALDLPITLMKDRKSFVMFDATEFGLVEYDDSLRIDTVQKEVEILSEALKKAAAARKGRHALLDRLGIALPQAPPPPVIESIVSPLIEEPIQETPKPKEPTLSIISPLPEYVGDPFSAAQIAKLKTGDELFHLHYGKGKVNFVKEAGKDKLGSIQFESGTKLLVLLESDFFRKVNG